MIALLVLIYGSFLWLVFGQFRLLPLNKWTGLAALLAGVAAIGGLVVVMNFYQPYTPDGRFYFYTTPIVSEVKGRVEEVTVKANEPVKAGDVLFRLGSTGYRISVDIARAAYDRAASAYDGARREYERSVELLQKKTISPQALDTARDSMAFAYNEAKRLRSALEDAQHDLNRTEVRAPADGFVTQLRLEPGAMAVPMPVAPLMTFVNTSKQDFLAAFRQNVLQEIDPGDPAELAFDALPGRIVRGEVGSILPVIAEGQLAPGGELLSANRRFPPGRAAVVIKITDDLSGFELPAGASAQVCIYTGRAKPTEIIRKTLIRMQAWKNYLFLP
jgi:RND family efflux transporter MFP subunit